MFRTQETLESGKHRIDEVVASFDDIGVRTPCIRSLAPESRG